MTTWWLLTFIATLLLGLAAFVWLAYKLSQLNDQLSRDAHKPRTAGEVAEQAAGDIFNDEFREELKNRGRMHFEKIIGENAMFLQKDLHLTVSQLNNFMKQEITDKLQTEFKKYEQSIMDAKQLAMDSIKKTSEAVEEQRRTLNEQVQTEYAAEKARLIKQFEANMADIVNHYVLAAIGDQIDLSAQLDFILSNLESNKKAILEDVSDGA